MPEIATIVSGRWKQNCYIIASANRAVVIDPGEDDAAIQASLDDRAIDVAAVLLTHAHYDHVASAAEVVERFRAPIYLHAADRKLLRQANLYRHLFGGERQIKIPETTVDLAGLPNLSIADIHLRVIHTPGHTAGSVSFLIDDSLFVGDLFAGTKLGRADLPGGDKAALKGSVQRLGASLPGTTVVYPGHGRPSSLGRLLETSDELAGASR